MMARASRFRLDAGEEKKEMRRVVWVFVVGSLLLAVFAVKPWRTGATARLSFQGGGQQSAIGPIARTFVVDGVERRALLYRNSSPAPASGAPLVFVFHGHGGNAQAIARKLPVHGLWPEAVVAYMQGLPGVAGITDPEGSQNGWQKNPGDVGDRDVRFVDAALAQIEKEFKIDASRIYALGHSNGARFVNVLWNMRGEKFAAFCSASGQGGFLIQTAIPKPIFVIAGEKDPLVPFENQKLSIELIRKRLETEPSKAVTKGYLRVEPGKSGTELATYLHPGGHAFPEEALPLAVGFFKRHPAG
jgi:polyhydroxybutyrate depolymerase